MDWQNATRYGFARHIARPVTFIVLALTGYKVPRVSFSNYSPGSLVDRRHSWCI